MIGLPLLALLTLLGLSCLLTHGCIGAYAAVGLHGASTVQHECAKVPPAERTAYCRMVLK